MITTKTPAAILQSSKAKATCEARPVARGNIGRVDRIVVGQEIIDNIFKAANVDAFLVHWIMIIYKSQRKSATVVYSNLWVNLMPM